MDTSQQEEEKRKERQLKIWSLVVPFFTLLLGTAIGYGLNQYSNRLRVLEYYVSSTPSLFPRPDLVGKKLVVTLDNRPVDNFSSATVFVVGSDQDLVNVPVYLRFSPVDGQPPNLIQVTTTLTPERYRETPLPDTGDGSIRRGYVIDVWNRGTVVRFDCLFEGTKPPEVSVETMAKGVVTQWLPIPTPPLAANWPFWDKIGGSVFFILGGLGILSLTSKFMNWISKTIKRRGAKGESATPTPSNPLEQNSGRPE